MNVEFRKFSQSKWFRFLPASVASKRKVSSISQSERIDNEVEDNLVPLSETTESHIDNFYAAVESSEQLQSRLNHKKKISFAVTPLETPTSGNSNIEKNNGKMLS